MQATNKDHHPVILRKDNIFLLRAIEDGRPHPRLEPERIWVWDVCVHLQEGDPPPFDNREKGNWVWTFPVRQRDLGHPESILFELRVIHGVVLTAANQELYDQLEAHLQRLRTEGLRSGGQRRPLLDEVIALLHALPPGSVNDPGPLLETEAGGFTVEPTIDSRPRKSNQKITVPWADGEFLQVPNIQGHGTRRMGQMLAGDVAWQVNDDGSHYLAQVGNTIVGMIRIGNDDEACISTDEAGRLINALGPGAIQTMVAVSKLIYEQTKGQPFNQIVTLSVRQVALAMKYQPDRHRGIDTAILRRIGTDLRAASRIMTWGVDGPWDRKARVAPSGWIAPLLHITAVHVEVPNLDGDLVPYEFDVALGRHWASAIKEHYDVVQIAPGFMELDPTRDAQAIRLAWYYLVEFRYRMLRTRQGAQRSIRQLGEDARLTVNPNQLGRFLTRLEGWHAKLRELGIIGSYERTPPLGSDRPPREIYEQGSYRVDPPPPVLEAYQEVRRKADNRRRAAVRKG